jgi:excisionase family DNA binding protein
VASYVGLPIKTIYKLRSDGDLCAGYRVGRWLRFKREDVLAWFETKRDEA